MLTYYSINFYPFCIELYDQRLTDPSQFIYRTKYTLVDNKSAFHRTKALPARSKLLVAIA